MKVKRIYSENKKIVVDLDVPGAEGLDIGVVYLIDQIRKKHGIPEEILVVVKDAEADKQDVFSLLQFLTSWYMTRGLKKVTLKLPVGKYNWLKDQLFSEFIEINHETDSNSLCRRENRDTPG